MVCIKIRKLTHIELKFKRESEEIAFLFLYNFVIVALNFHFVPIFSRFDTEAKLIGSFRKETFIKDVAANCITLWASDIISCLFAQREASIIEKCSAINSNEYIKVS